MVYLSVPPIICKGLVTRLLDGGIDSHRIFFMWFCSQFRKILEVNCGLNIYKLTYSSFLLGPDGDLADHQWLDQLVIHHLLKARLFCVVFEGRLFSIDYEVYPAAFVIAGHLFDVDFVERGTPVEKFGLRMAFENWLPRFVLLNNLWLLVAGVSAEAYWYRIA